MNNRPIFHLYRDQEHIGNGAVNQSGLRIDIEKDFAENTQKKSIYGILKTHATEISTAHGIPIIFKSKHWYGKLFWTLIVLVALGAFGRQAYYLLRRYFDSPVAVEVSLNSNLR